MVELRCPHCGNEGEEGDEWEANAPGPFRLVEEVLRSWYFDIVEREGELLLLADPGTDKVDWESGNGLRIECCACFEHFPIPTNLPVDFDP